MNPGPTLLLVEDDPAMREGLKDNLEFEGYSVLTAGTVRDGHEAALERHPSLVLLDVMLPDGNGIELCRQLRAQGFAQPILMLTAKAEEMDRVLGLELGADDYIVKPFSLRELLARVKAHLRRVAVLEPDAGVVHVGVATVDFSRHQLLRQGEPIDTSAREFALLQCLVKHRGRTVSRDTLLAEVWGHNGDLITRAVDNFIVKLRRKIEEDPANPRTLLTVHGAGYKLVEQ